MANARFIATNDDDWMAEGLGSTSSGPSELGRSTHMALGVVVAIDCHYYSGSARRIVK